MHPILRLTPDNDGNSVLIQAARIAAIHHTQTRPAGSEGALAECETGVDVLDCSGARIEPGLVNAHTHLYSGLAPLGMPSPMPKPSTFVEILERVWWRLDRALDAQCLTAAARLYVAEALLSGTTTLIDHHESPNLIHGSLDILADACETLGCRALLGYGATERNQGQQEARAGLAECQRFIREGLRPLVRGVVALHASFTVSDATVREAARLCEELGTVLHIHLAEAASDVEDAKSRGYAGPLERLLALGALPPGSILAHGVHLSREQVRRAAEAGAFLIHNPRSNRGNEVGYASSLEATERVALGTDGYPARMQEECGVGAELALAHGQRPELASERLAKGAQLASERFGETLGVLEPGTAADLVVRVGERCRHVIVGGKVVVRDGKLEAGNIDEIRREAQEQAAGLWQRMSVGP